MGANNTREQDAEAIAKANIAKANKSGLIPKKASLIVYAVVLILAVLARTVQLYTNMNFSTGRYYDPSPIKNYTLIVIIPGFILIALTLLLGSARNKVVGSCILINPWRLRYDRLNKKIPGSAGYSAALMACLVLGEIIFDFVDIVHRNKEVVKTMSAKEADNYSMLTGYTVPMAINHFVMLLVILTFVSMAVNIFKGDGFSHANCAALMIYCVWKTVRMIIDVFSTTAIALSSESVYELLAGMVSVLFFLNAARFFNGMEKPSTRFWLCFTGYTSSILASVSVIPRYIMMLIPTGLDERLDMEMPSLSDVGLVFITITIVAVFWSTYVYRVMPKLNVKNRRWSKGPMSKKYQTMEDMDESKPNNQ